MTAVPGSVDYSVLSYNALLPLASTDPIYSHRCSLPDRTLWFGRARLFEDRVHVTGWTWRGRYQREIPVAEIDEVEWQPRPAKPNLILYLDDGDVFQLRLRKGAGLWNAKLHDFLGESLLEGQSLRKNGHTDAKTTKEEDEDQKAA